MSSNKYRGWKIVLLLLVVFLLPVHAGETAEKKAFNPGEFVVGHVTDSYSWHITKSGETELSIPLLVIVKSQDRGWFAFCSCKLNEGATYRGFKIADADPYKNKVVEILPNNEMVRPTDISITKDVASLLICSALVLWIVLSLARHYKKAPMKAPGGFLGAIEFVVIFVQDEVIKPCVGSDYKRYSPYLLTLFFFILINNLMGLIPVFPGGANVSGNLAITSVMAICTFLAINLFGNKEYWKDIFWPEVPTWLKVPLPIMPFLELFGIFTKPIALMVRLFANMLAGHMIAMVFMAMIFIFGAISPLVGTGVSVFAIFFAIFMNFLELLVCVIQAYVFTLLSSVFIGLSRIEPHKKEI
ncbi:MAG: F0F1 ATP synthase subunit A [Bacteroidales bacterium]